MCEKEKDMCVCLLGIGHGAERCWKEGKRAMGDESL
jgi:hypothetical protein